MFPIAALSLDKRPEARLKKTPPTARQASTKYPIVPVRTAPGMKTAMIIIFFAPSRLSSHPNARYRAAVHPPATRNQNLTARRSWRMVLAGTLLSRLVIYVFVSVAFGMFRTLVAAFLSPFC